MYKLQRDGVDFRATLFKNLAAAALSLLHSVVALYKWFKLEYFSYPCFVTLLHLAEVKFYAVPFSGSNHVSGKNLFIKLICVFTFILAP